MILIIPCLKNGFLFDTQSLYHVVYCKTPSIKEYLIILQFMIISFYRAPISKKMSESGQRALRQTIKTRNISTQFYGEHLLTNELY